MTAIHSKQYQREFLGLKHTSIVAPKESRPRCRYCGTPLQLRTWTVWFDSFGGSESREADNARTLAAGKGWSTVELRLDEDGCSTGEPKRLGVWDGGYCGYGWDSAKDNEPLFCKQPCALLFANAAFHAGYRIKRKDAGA